MLLLLVLLPVRLPRKHQRGRSSSSREEDKPGCAFPSTIQPHRVSMSITANVVQPGCAKPIHSPLTILGERHL
jgi:hypothetical protein